MLWLVKEGLQERQHRFLLRVADLFRAGMLIEPGHVHLAVAHRIHDRHQISRALHRVRRKAMTSTVEHDGCRNPGQSLGAVELFLHGFKWPDVARAEGKTQPSFASPLRANKAAL